MTELWAAIALAAMVAGFWLARPLLARGKVELNESDSSISIYRDQADELRRDLDAGLIAPDEYDAARQEIEVRTLHAARRMGEGLSVSRRSPAAAIALAVLFSAGAIAFYASFGTPLAGDRPLAERKLEELNRRASSGDLKARVELLVERTKKDPESFEDWWMLARGYAATGDHASAADAYRRAAELSGDKPNVLSAYAESLTLANGNKVPQAARLVFEQILQSGPDPRARYYVALSKAQAQDFEAALGDWTTLAAESEPSAPWMQLVRRDIVNMARFLKRDVTEHLPDATPQEIARAGGDPAHDVDAGSQASVLAARLELEPKDYKGWIELARLRVASGENEGAADALDRARDHFAAAPFVLGKIEEAARGLGLDILRAEPAVRGPSDEDVAAAGAMSEDERASMIEGMVAGLAAKLEDNPDNPDGWVMLVRSYTVLGDDAKARAAYDKALAHYGDDAMVLARLKSDLAEVVKTE